MIGLCAILRITAIAVNVVCKCSPGGMQLQVQALENCKNMQVLELQKGKNKTKSCSAEI